MLETVYFSSWHMHQKFVHVDAIVAHPVFIHYLGEQENVCYSTWVEPNGPITR